MGNRTEIMNTLAKHKKELESQGYKVAYISLFGSQNYGLDVYTEDYQSDIDTKAIIVPTLDDLINNSKPVSEVVEMDSGQCDVKDIRTYFDTLMKANPSYVEALYSDYNIVDEDFKEQMDEVLENRDELVYALRGQFIRAMYGSALEKQKRLSHPYPTVAHKIERHGYCGKQLSHIIRLYELMHQYFIDERGMHECMFPTSEIQYLILKAKLNNFSLEEAETLATEYVGKCKDIVEHFLSNYDEKRVDYSIKKDYLKLSRIILRNKIKKDIKGELS